ncbi:hypothetical protein [Streptomyces albidoflavus]|uniref:hypothetical protein n=1 Tax=Streptomyces albidoflavus TaxID=1886 RepID=UPI0033CFE4CE
MALLVEVGWGGVVQYPWSITWTDISRRVSMTEGISITRGAADERSETQPGSCTMTLDNQDGALTPGNASSPFYPFVRRNAPIRVAVAIIPTRTGAGPTWPLGQLGDDFDDDRIGTALWPSVYGGSTETGGRARVPLASGVVAGFQSARVWRLAGSQLSAKLARVPAANGSSSASASMWVLSTTAGTRLGFSYSPVTGQLRLASETAYFDGAAVSLPYSPIDHAWLRVRESAGALRWETSRDGFIWTTRRTLATPVWVTSQTVLVDFSATRTGGATDYVEWDLVNATVRPRFWGMVNEFPVDWQGLHSSVTISATDLFKRLNRLPELRPMLTEEVSTSGALAYYPLTEASGTSAGDISGRGQPPLVRAQVGSGGTLAMAAVDGPPATGEQAPLATPVSATAGKYWVANLGADVANAISTYYFAAEAWFKGTEVTRAILGMSSWNYDQQIVIGVSSIGGLMIEWTDWIGGSLIAEGISGTTGILDDQWHHLVYDRGSNRFWLDGVMVDSTIDVPHMYDLRRLHVGGYRSSRLWSGSIAHVGIYAPTDSTWGANIATHYGAGATGHEGETADARITRLAKYAGLSSVSIWGDLHDPVAGQGAGGQPALARMREVEKTESARLWAERDWYGLAYQSRGIRYNPSPASDVVVLDYADLETSRVQLADDDQKLVNIVDAARPGGATQRVTAPESVLAFGQYEESLDILKTTDSGALAAAYWMVSRYGNPLPELREVPVEAYTHPRYLDILDAEIGSAITVTGLPAQAPAASMRVMVEGYVENIRSNSHLIQFHTSAAATDSVWKLGDPDYSRLGITTRIAY